MTRTRIFIQVGVTMFLRYERGDCPCIDAVCDRIADDSDRAYIQLEHKPCHRAAAMLCQWIPVLAIAAFLFLLILPYAAASPHPAPVLLFLCIIGGTLVLLFVVGRDIVRALIQLFVSLWWPEPSVV